jgi:hypothetical protein
MSSQQEPSTASVDPDVSRVDTTGLDDYLQALVLLGLAVLADATEVVSAIGDETRGRFT